MVTRLEGWPLLLSAYIKERQDMPFQWGVNDCMAFVAKGVEELTGEDFFSLYNDYTDEASAAAMLEANGGPQGIIRACLGAPIAKVKKAGRGDVVLVRMPEVTGGLVDDSGRWIAVVTPAGIRRVPLDSAIMAWSY